MIIAFRCKSFIWQIRLLYNFCFLVFINEDSHEKFFFSFSVTHVLFNHIDKSGLKGNSVEELKKRYGGWFPFLLKLLSLTFIYKFSTESVLLLR